MSNILRSNLRNIWGKAKKLSRYSALTALTLVLGFLREIVVASKFGLSAELDVYVAVLGFYSFLGLGIGNALDTVFVSQVARRGGVDHVRSSLEPPLLHLFTINIFFLPLILILTGDMLIRIIFPGFDQDQQELGAQLIVIMVFAIAFSNTAGLLRGGLNVLRIFAPGFLAGGLVSVCSIVSVLLLADRIGIESLAFGLLLGNLFVFLLFLGTLLRKRALRFRFRKNLVSKNSFMLWGASVVVIIGDLVYIANSMTQNSFASTLDPGTISSFYYALTLMMVPLAVVTGPLTTMLYPKLVETMSQNRKAGARLVKLYGMLVVALSILAAVILFLFSQFVVEAVFARGAFTKEDAERTSELLSILVLALPLMGLRRLIHLSLYCLSDYKTPLYGLIFQWIVLIAMGSFLVSSFGAGGLAVAIVTAQLAGTLLSTSVLARKLQRA